MERDSVLSLPDSEFVPQLTVTVNAQVLLPPLLSTARHTLVVKPCGNVEPEAKPLSKNTDCTLQLSVAVGVVYITGMLHWPAGAVTDTSPGQVMEGGATSVTVTANEQVLVRPAPSVARHTTVFVPFGKFEPEAKPLVFTTVGGGVLLSAAVGVV